MMIRILVWISECLVQEGRRFAQERNIGARPSSLRTCVESGVLLGSTLAWSSRQIITWENAMAWKTPKIVEVPVGMEINMYACAARK
jgi:coenzyme PQQ precursor peptide PqqA